MARRPCTRATAGLRFGLLCENLRMAIRIRAHAKINLNLRVLGRRPDGYHDLSTVFQALALHDLLAFEPRPGPFAINCSEPGVPVDSTNLVWQAADRLWQHLRRDGPVRDVEARMDKRIPMKAGLGGGSADAAATLLALARLWEPDLPADTLVGLGKELGADVPFFFTGGAALGLDRGDDIHPLPDLPSFDVLLAFPPFDVSTADAYGWLDEDRGRAGGLGPAASVLPAQYVPGCSWPPASCEVVNDFETVVSRRHPQIAEIVAALRAAGAAAAMTGSGSAVFGLFARQDARSKINRVHVPGGEGDAPAQAAGVLAARGLFTERTRTLTRAEYSAAAAPACL